MNSADRSPTTAIGVPRPLADPEKPKPVGAQLDFMVDAAGRTYLGRQFATYPYHLTRAFHLDRAEPAAATVYLQSLSGGLVQGDHVTLHISAAQLAIAHVSTQAATKVHSMQKGFALQEVSLRALSASHLEYIADPTICFPRSRLISRAELCIAPDASAILSECYLWHDPQGLQTLAFDSLNIETAVRRPNGRIIALDRSRLSSNSDLRGNPALLGPYRALGTLFAIGRRANEEATLSALRKTLAMLPGIYAGVSRLPAEAGLWLRILATDGASLRAAMNSAWQECHEGMLGWACDHRRK